MVPDVDRLWQQFSLANVSTLLSFIILYYISVGIFLILSYLILYCTE